MGFETPNLGRKRTFLGEKQYFRVKFRVKNPNHLQGIHKTIRMQQTGSKSDNYNSRYTAFKVFRKNPKLKKILKNRKKISEAMYPIPFKEPTFMSILQQT